VARKALTTSPEDWDFAHLGIKATQESVHFFHHWTAKFIPQIPRRVIESYARPGDLVLDPFMGCGTALVEAARLGHDAWGTDISPLAVRIARAKTAQIDDARLGSFIEWLARAAADPQRHRAGSPRLFEGSEAWFREDVARAISRILKRARGLDEATRNFVHIGLSDLLKGMSNARMDRTIPALPRSPRYTDKKHYHRVVDNRTRHIDPFARLRAQLVRMRRALAEFHASATGRAFPIEHDARDLAALGRRAQLAVTSPPYWSAQNYQRMHLLSFRVLGLREPGGGEIGRRAQDYLPDMQRVIEQLALVLEGHFALVIGESKDGIHEAVRDLCRARGMRLIRTFGRRIFNQAFFAKAVKREFVYVFRT
jgi:site-specific DNA-methyltransferase (cytosine-N4-specific)